MPHPDSRASLERRLNILSGVGLLFYALLGLGTHALIHPGEAVVAILNDNDVAWACIVVGGAWVAWEVPNAIALLRRARQAPRDVDPD